MLYHNLYAQHYHHFLCADPAVVRRLLFQAKYSLRCGLLQQNLTHHLIEVTARGGVHHIREICDGGMYECRVVRLKQSKS